MWPISEFNNPCSVCKFIYPVDVLFEIKAFPGSGRGGFFLDKSWPRVGLFLGVKPFVPPF